MTEAQSQPVDETTVAYTLGGFVLRTPLLPVATVLDLARGVELPASVDDDGFSRACELVRGRLRALVLEPDIAEALFVASPSLIASLPRWLDDPGGERGVRVERTLIKYLTRMSTRPTPFGLFSGCSVGRSGEQTRLSLSPRRRYTRHSRLDMDYLFSLTEALNGSDEVRRKVLFRPNDTLVRLGSRLRYVEPRVDPTGGREYRWVAAESTPYLEHVLEKSSTGATIAELADAIVAQDDEVAPPEALSYVVELVDAHLLVSTLQPNVTGPEPTGTLVGQLRALGVDRVAATLERVAAELHRLDASGLGHSRDAYVSMATALEELPAPVDVSRIVQVDLTKPGDFLLGPKVRAELTRCLEHVAAFAPPFDVLARFCTAFDKRYGAAAVPLLEALDPEAGIPLEEAPVRDESPLLAGMPAARAAMGDEEGAPWKARHGWLLERLHHAWEARANELVISTGDLEPALGKKDSSSRSTAFSLHFTLVAESMAALDDGDFQILLRGSEGPGGARVLGRFAHAHPDIEGLAREHLAEEEAQAPEAIWAEIVHLPHGRLGNILLRPVLREYELTYMGRSAAPPERQLPFSDLLVSVLGQRVTLWSARLGRQVIPRLTNSHNFWNHRNLQPYRFLAMLQAQGSRTSFTWDWGPLASAPFLPRVRWDRVVFSTATWRVTRRDIDEMAKGTRRQRFLNARAWSQRRRLPRLAYLVDADNQLLVDFDNPLSVDAFVDLLRSRPGATLKEMWPGPDQLCVTGAEGRFTHEVCVPVIGRPLTEGTSASESPASEMAPYRPAVGFRRSIAPGGDWLFLKVYAAPSEVDRVLVEAVQPLAAAVITEGLADRWFFIRYGDPEHHLRLRFHGDPRLLHAEVLARAHQALSPWLEAGSINRLMLDTYQPEIERYGGPVGLEMAEQIFQADSEAVLEILALLQGDAGATTRWQLALAGLDGMIDDFGLDAAAKRALVARRRREYGIELGRDPGALKRWLAGRFRSCRLPLASLWAEDGNGDENIASGLKVWKARSAKLTPLVARLRQVGSIGQISAPLGALIDTHLHMYVNRIARAEGRSHELVLFDFLDRHYQAADARGRRMQQART